VRNVEIGLDNLKKLSFPFDLKKALKTGIYAGGTSGSGKTNLLYQIADYLMSVTKEELAEIGYKTENKIVVYVFDASQAWQENSSIPYVIHIDKVPMTLDHFPITESVIIDTSKLYVKEQRQVVTDICKVLFTYKVNQPKEKRIWHFLLFEEAQLYLQPSSMRANSGAEVMRLITVGRNFRIRYGLVTQFPSTVDKLPVKMTQQRYFGYTDEKNDKEYIKEFIGKERSEELETFKPGQFYYKCGRTIEKIDTPLFKSTVKAKPFDPCEKELCVVTPEEKQEEDFLKWALLILILCAIGAIIMGLVLNRKALIGGLWLLFNNYLSSK